MGDKDYRYPVALKWVQGGEKLKKVKNALLLYFQSPKQCNGGECEIRDTDCSPGYIVIYFKDKEAQQRVVQKNPHTVTVQSGSTASGSTASGSTASGSTASGSTASGSTTSGSTASGSTASLSTILVHASLLDAEKARSMGGVFSPASSSDDGTAGSSTDKDTDHQPGDNRSSGIPKRKISSTTDPDPGNGAPKRLGDDSMGQEWERGVGGIDGKENSSAPKSLTENDEYNNHGDSGAPRNGSRKDALRRQSSKEPGKDRHAAPSEDNGEPWSILNADHQQGNNQNTDNWERSPSLTDRGSMDGGPTGQRAWENRSGIDGKGQDINSSAPSSLPENDKSKSLQFTPGNESRRNPLRQPMGTEVSGKNHPAARPEIFLSVTAKVDKKLISNTLVEEIKAEIPSLSINHGSDFVEVIGKFAEIELVDRYLRGKLEPAIDAVKPPETPSYMSPLDSQADQVCVPSALYEYIMEIYRTEMDKIQRTYKVKIAHGSTPEGSTYVRFISHGSDSSPEKAKEIFTDKVQKGMDDWSQVTVDASLTPLTISDIKERVTNLWSNTLVIQGENMGIILRGPRDELSQVKKFLETTDHKPARPRRAVTISTDNMKTEIEVDARHMDILKKLKHRQISDIEKKYNVKMEERSKNGSSFVTFRSMNASPDLSPHASHSFVTLLQKTFFNIEKKEFRVKPEFQEENVNIVQEQLMMAGIDILMEYSKGTVLLIGHPVHVAFAVEKLDDRQNPGEGQAAAASKGKPDSNSSSAAAQKPEEPDKCPICLCEVEDKVTLKCKHAYCKGCFQQATAHKPVCAICGVPYGTVIGDQPDGTMRVTTNTCHLPGYPKCGTIEIFYDIPSGTQKDNHPHPGRPFYGTTRTAYLPDNKEGKDILRLLRKAFDQKLIFTVGDSRTTGATDTVTWNDVHHKTNTHGGSQGFGYPDPDYLTRVRDELKAKGVE